MRYSPGPMRKPLLLLSILGLAACSEPQKVAKLGETIPHLPVPPSSDVISREGGEDALKIRFRSVLDPEEVATYYRNVLSKDPWRLISDAKDGTGGIALYAEQTGGPPLWVSIRKADGAPGSYVDLAGAKTKSQ